MMEKEFNLKDRLIELATIADKVPEIHELNVKRFKEITENERMEFE